MELKELCGGNNLPCDICRRKGAGETARRVAWVHCPEVREMDFQCPDGKPWIEEEPTPKAFVVPDGAEAVCLDCAESCGNKHKCCGGKVSVFIRMECPHGKWASMPKITS